MENATKALLIGGGILIAMLVIGVGVLIFNNYGEASLTYEQTLQATEIQKFNVNFMQFEGREDISIHEIVTLANFVKQYNNKVEENIKVKVLISGEGDALTKDMTGIIKKYPDKKFRCRNIEYFTDGSESGKVNSIEFY